MAQANNFRGGYHACLARRNDHQGLDRLVKEIEAGGGSATGCILNAAEDGSIGLQSRRDNPVRDEENRLRARGSRG